MGAGQEKVGRVFGGEDLDRQRCGQPLPADPGAGSDDYVTGPAPRQKVGDCLGVVDVVEGQQPPTVSLQPAAHGVQHQFLA
jgi:hypothetical protein